MQLRSWENRHITEAKTDVMVKGTIISGAMYEVARIHFKTNSEILDNQDMQVLDHLAGIYVTILSTLPRPLVMAFIGMADRRGGKDLNIRLSQRRATAAAEYFRQSLNSIAGPGRIRTVTIHSDGHGEPPEDEEIPRHPNEKMELARWRRVAVYTNLPPIWVKIAFSKMSDSCRKMAERALRRTRAARNTLRKNVKYFRGKAAGTAGSSVYSTNYSELAWEEQRLMDYERKLEELRRAILSGDKAFLAWQRNSRSSLGFMQDYARRLESERQRLKALLSLGGSDQAILRETIEDLTHMIEDIKEYIQLIKDGKVTNA